MAGAISKTVTLVYSSFRSLQRNRNMYLKEERYLVYSEPTGTSACYCIPCPYTYLTVPMTRAVVNVRT
jgi:hypothetical protein